MGSSLPSFLFSLPPHLLATQKKRIAWRTVADGALPGQRQAAMFLLLWQLPREGDCLSHFVQSVCEYLLFTEDKKGQELWNSIEGQSGNLSAWSSFLLYSDIWCPLPEQIRAIPSSSRGGGLPVLRQHSHQWEHRN